MTPTAESQWPWKKPLLPVKRGAFIVIEGLDRSGKTTQVKRLCDRLYSLGHNIKTLRFPDRESSIGQLINNYLQNSADLEDHAVHLLFSANRWEKAKWIRDNLSAGYTIVCDRYSLSGVAYSAAKNNPSLSMEWAKNSDIGLPSPDVTVFLDISPQDAEKRGGFGKEKYEEREFQEQIRTLFLNLLNSMPQTACVQIIDANQPIDEVERQMFDAINKTVASTVFGVSG